MPVTARPIRTAALSALALSALLLAGCSAAEPAADAETPTSAAVEPADLAIQNRWLNNVQFAGSFVADAEGYYADELLTVTITPGGPGVNVEPLVVQGTADLATSNPTNAANAAAQGAPVTIVGAVYQSSPSAILSLPEDPIEEPEDLVGKKVGVTTANTTFVPWLQAQGVSADDVEIIPIQGDPSPLTSGQVDAIFGLSTNQGVALELAGYDPVILDLTDYGRASMDLVMVVQTAALEDPVTRSALVRYLAAEILGWERVIADPEAAVDIVVSGPGKDLDLDPAQQLLQAQATNPLIQPEPSSKILWMSDELIADTLSTLASDGVDADEALFDNSLVEEAYGLLGRG